MDSNKDGQISRSEAEKVTTLYLIGEGLSHTEDLDAFQMLDTLVIRMNYLPEIKLTGNKALTYLEITACELNHLDISENQNLLYLDVSGGAVMSNSLDSIDLSKNTQLKTIFCKENDLKSLDISNKLQLEVLDCGRNRLEEIDVSQNTALVRFILNNNLVTHLDLSHNINLTKMISCGNQLTSLDISVNTSLTNIGIDNMPSLHNVNVWTLPFPPGGVSVLMGFSPNIEFISNK